jgi:hypothetical protein
MRSWVNQSYFIGLVWYRRDGRYWREAVIRQKEAEAELVAKAPILSDRRAGTAETVPLDEDHGLRISIRGHPGSWPVSMIKFAQKQVLAGE